MFLTSDKKKQIINDYEAFWNHSLKRPIINVTLLSRNSPFSNAQLLKLVHNFDVSAIDVAEAYRKTFESNTYLGDGFPSYYLRSIGVLGGMMDEPYRFDEKNGTIWFEELGLELKDMHLKLNKESKLYKRGLEIYSVFQDTFKDDVAFGAPDFGSVNDVLASLRGSNNLLMDLYDNPDEVTRCLKEIDIALKDAYLSYTDAISKKPNLGYTAWIPLLSQIPYSVAEADFICMISKEMAKEFVIPYLESANSYMKRCLYHLDGPGAVKHLDNILDVNFEGIQWINGAGSLPLDDEKWTHIYEEVHAKNQILQVYVYSKEQLHFIDHIYNILGTLQGVAFICYGLDSDRPIFEEYLEKYGVPK